jgi:hypothetical protein
MPPLYIFDAGLLMGTSSLAYLGLFSIIFRFPEDPAPKARRIYPVCTGESHYFYVVDCCISVSTFLDLQSFRVLALRHSPFLSRTSGIFTKLLNTMKLESHSASSNELSAITIPPFTNMKPSAVDTNQIASFQQPPLWPHLLRTNFQQLHLNNYYTTLKQAFNDNSTTHLPK